MVPPMPRQSKPPDRSTPRWTVHLMRGRRADRLGDVRAKDEAEAIDLAVEEFRLKDWQRRRVLVRREPY